MPAHPSALSNNIIIIKGHSLRREIIMMYYVTVQNGRHLDNCRPGPYVPYSSILCCANNASTLDPAVLTMHQPWALLCQQCINPGPCCANNASTLDPAVPTMHQPWTWTRIVAGQGPPQDSGRPGWIVAGQDG